jgi:hypothetical protein
MTTSRSPRVPAGRDVPCEPPTAKGQLVASPEADAVGDGKFAMATFVPRPPARCSICRHAAPAGVDTCTTCLADYGLPLPGVA